MNRPPACIFDVNEMGNKEFTWSGLKKCKCSYTRGRSRLNGDKLEMIVKCSLLQPLENCCGAENHQ